MKRCSHSWRPLLVLPSEIPADKRLVVAFGVGLSHLDRYDHCDLCGRLSYIRKSRRAPRSLISCPETEASIRKRAVETQAWIDGELTT